MQQSTEADTSNVTEEAAMEISEEERTVDGLVRIALGDGGWLRLETQRHIILNAWNKFLGE